MKDTKIVKCDSLNLAENYIEEAADIIRGGGLVIMPTETVYGIAADMSNRKTLDRLYEIKKRPRDKLFSLHIDTEEKIEKYAKDIPIAAYKLIDRFWPGPLTIILEFTNSGKIGIRMPDNKIALRIILKANVPVVCPSANISGNSPPVIFEDAIKDLGGLVDFAIDSGRTKLGIESTVVDLTVQPPQILREKAINKKSIEEVIAKKIILFVCTGNSCRSVMAKALLEKFLNEKNRNDLKVLSAGIMMFSGLTASNETVELLKREGIDVSMHRSQRVAPGMLKKSDIILVMEKIHEERILELVPEAKNRVFLLKEFAKIKTNNLDIEDPIGKSLEFYENTFQTIKEAVQRISEII